LTCLPPAPIADHTRDCSNRSRFVAPQEPQFDYYAWEPDRDEFTDERFLRFVEVSDLPVEANDLVVTQELSHYR